eukprot:COSAG01_NODE_4252_length_5206_cov_4.404151_7_plen_226_part_00
MPRRWRVEPAPLQHIRPIDPRRLHLRARRGGVSTSAANTDIADRVAGAVTCNITSWSPSSSHGSGSVVASSASGPPLLPTCRICTALRLSGSPPATRGLLRPASAATEVKEEQEQRWTRGSAPAGRSIPAGRGLRRQAGALRAAIAVVGWLQRHGRQWIVQQCNRRVAGYALRGSTVSAASRGPAAAGGVPGRTCWLPDCWLQGPVRLLGQCNYDCRSQNPHEGG